MKSGSTEAAVMAKSDIEIAREATMLPIGDIAARLEVLDGAIAPYGKHIAKISLDFVQEVADRPDGRLILVTAITPTPAGEGKTTTTVGLSDALNRIGKKAMSCTREPSLGPCFGMKGGAAGGGYAQVVPMENINLHFTGDFHAVGTAHNLLAALIDNHIYWGNALNLDQRRITWRRVVDMNDRALRSIVNSLGGVANGFPLEDNPAFIHGGPFANIAHGCNSVMATRLALKLCDYVVTEAGFGADLGAEKFFDIKCRKAGLTPDAAVIVATIRALKMHGGVGREDLGKENLAAVRKGLANLGRHVSNVRKFGVPAVGAVNQVAGGPPAAHAPVGDYL